MPKSALGWIVLVFIGWWVVTDPAAAGHAVSTVFHSISTFFHSL